MIDAEKILDCWRVGAPARDIARELKCSPSTVWRIVRVARAAGDVRAIDGEVLDKRRELYLAHKIAPRVAALYGECSIDSIAAAVKQPPRIVRAAIYLARPQPLAARAA